MITTTADYGYCEPTPDEVYQALLIEYQALNMQDPSDVERAKMIEAMLDSADDHYALAPEEG